MVYLYSLVLSLLTLKNTDHINIFIGIFGCKTLKLVWKIKVKHCDHFGSTFQLFEQGQKNKIIHLFFFSQTVGQMLEISNMKSNPSPNYELVLRQIQVCLRNVFTNVCYRNKLINKRFYRKWRVSRQATVWDPGWWRTETRLCPPRNWPSTKCRRLNDKFIIS